MPALNYSKTLHQTFPQIFTKASSYVCFNRLHCPRAYLARGYPPPRSPHLVGALLRPPSNLWLSSVALRCRWSPAAGVKALTPGGHNERPHQTILQSTKYLNEAWEGFASEQPRSLASISSRASASHSLTWRGNDVSKSRFKNFFCQHPSPPDYRFGCSSVFPAAVIRRKWHVFTPGQTSCQHPGFRLSVKPIIWRFAIKRLKSDVNSVSFYQVVGADKGY